MILILVIIFSLTSSLTNIGIQKNDRISLKTYDIVSTDFLLQDNLSKLLFFEETFLLTDISIKMTIRIFFLCFSNTNIKFDIERLIRRSYTITKIILITK